MKSKLGRLAVIPWVLFILGACGGGPTPEEQLREIDALMQDEFTMTQNQMRDIMGYTETGKRLLRQGKTDDASQNLAKALEILHQIRASGSGKQKN